MKVKVILLVVVVKCIIVASRKVDETHRELIMNEPCHEIHGKLRDSMIRVSMTRIMQREIERKSVFQTVITVIMKAFFLFQARSAMAGRERESASERDMTRGHFFFLWG